jgi:tRNA(fMet)-specific endonuclease VapC
MDKALLDTDIFSEVLKGKDRNVVNRATAYQAVYGRYTSSLITLLEIVKGYQKVQREDRIKQFLTLASAVEWLTLDLASAEIAGRILGELERTGHPIGRADPLIAAIALQYDLTLVTGNTRHYQHIQHLGYSMKLDNWRS